jgi:hypothetical protein
MLDHARGCRLAKLRKRRHLTQDRVATRMGVAVARISQIDSGDVSVQGDGPGRWSGSWPSWASRPWWCAQT